MKNLASTRVALAAVTLFAGFVASPPRVRAVTPEELAEAIGPAALSFENIVFTTWADSGTTRQIVSHVSYDSSLAAAPGRVPGSLLLSTGRAADGGLGDSYLWRPNWRDGTSFEFTISSPPPQAKYLVFTLQFITSEIDASRRYDDWAYGGTSVVGSSPCQHGDVVLARVSGSMAAHNPRFTRVIDVQDLSATRTRHVSFCVADARDGRRDSAILLSRVFFTGANMLSPDQLQEPCGDVIAPPEYNVSSGTCTFSRELLHVPGRGLPFSFTVYYSSSQIQDADLGRKWRHSFDWDVKPTDEGVVLTRGDGGREYFKADGGAFVAEYGNHNEMRRSGGGYEYVTKTRMHYLFDSAGSLTTIRDGNDLTLQLARPPNFVYITDTRGNTAVLQYEGGRASRLDYGDRTVTFTYADANLESFTEPGGRTTRFTYDDRSNLLTATNNDGVRFMDNDYLDEKVVAKRDANGAGLIFTYDQTSLRTRNRLGQERIDGFDARDRLVENVKTSGARTTFEYDLHNNVVRRTAPNLAVTEMAYDTNGNMTRKMNALGHAITLAYGSTANPSAPTAVTDEAGNTRRYEYDAKGNMLEEVDPAPLGTAITYTYTAAGQLHNVTDRSGNVSSFQYSAVGDLERIEQPAGIGGGIQFTYDELGRKTSETDPNGNTTRFEYDAAGRLARRIDALGGSTSYTYDADGRTLTEVDPMDVETRYAYTPTGCLASTMGPFGTTIYRYDAEGRLVSQTDPMGRTSRFEYDAGDRLVGVIAPTGERVSATYDALGNRLSVTDARGGQLFYRYDILGRLIEEVDPLGNVATYQYDRRGFLERTVNARHQSTVFRYDVLGRVVQITTPEGTTTHTLDGNGNRVRSQGPGGQTLRTFDALNRITSRTDELGRSLHYSRDPGGNLTGITYSDGRQVTYRYDTLNRLIEVEDWNQNLTSYSYDAAGNLLETRLPDGSRVRYRYDRNRLLEMEDVAHDSTICSAQLQCDATGLPTRIEGRRPLDPVLATAEMLATYDAANRLVSMDADSLGYDAEGNLTSSTRTGAPMLHVYDALNQLLQADADTYRYDSDGLRLESIIAGTRRNYVHDPSTRFARLLEEWDESGNRIASYVYGIGLISRENSEGSLQVYHFDAQGNTVALTNAGGQITDRYAFDPYGRIVARRGTTANPFTFSSRFGVVDDGNGLYFARSRYYSSDLMRFTQRDRTSRGSLMDLMSLNPYAYAGGNPIVLVDPNGDIAQWIIGAVIGFVVGIAVQTTLDLVAGEFSGWGAYASAAIVGTVAGATMGLGSGISFGANFGLNVGAVALGNVTEQTIDKGADAMLSGGFDIADFGLEVGVASATLGISKGVEKLATRTAGSLAANNVSKEAGKGAAANLYADVVARKSGKALAATASEEGLVKQGLKQYAKRAGGKLAAAQVTDWFLGLQVPAIVLEPCPDPDPVPHPYRDREPIDP